MSTLAETFGRLFELQARHCRALAGNGVLLDLCGVLDSAKCPRCSRVLRVSHRDTLRFDTAGWPVLLASTYVARLRVLAGCEYCFLSNCRSQYTVYVISRRNCGDDSEAPMEDPMEDPTNRIMFDVERFEKHGNKWMLVQ